MSPNRTPGFRGWICPSVAALLGCSFQDFDRLGPGESAVSNGGSVNHSSAGGGGSSNGGGTGYEVGGSDEIGDSGVFVPGQDPAAIVNPSFENGRNGWLFEPPEAAGLYAFVQWPVTGSSTVDGLNELSTWAESEAFTVRIYQSLTELDDGRYTFKGNFNFGTGHNAVYLFARHCGGAERRQDVQQTLPTQWLEVELAAIEVIGGSCDVGFVVDANPNNWLNADFFSFEPASE